MQKYFKRSKETAQARESVHKNGAQEKKCKEKKGKDEKTQRNRKGTRMDGKLISKEEIKKFSQFICFTTYITHTWHVFTNIAYICVTRKPTRNHQTLQNSEVSERN